MIKSVKPGLMNDRDSNIIVDCLLPLEDAVELHFNDTIVNVPNTHLITSFFRRGDDIIATLLEEDSFTLNPDYNPGDLTSDSILHVLKLGTSESEQIGYVRISDLGLNGTMSGFMIREDDLVFDIFDLFNQKSRFIDLLLHHAYGISTIRYGLNKLDLKPVSQLKKKWIAEIPFRSGGVVLSTEFEPVIKPFKTDTPLRRINGYVKHDTVKRYNLSTTPEEESMVLSSLNNLDFKIDPKFGSEYKIKAPVIGAYTHPFDDSKIMLARLMGQGTENYSRNRILITELGETERDIGHVYFRVLPDKILADGFYVGEGFTTLIDPEEGQKFRGLGLGSRVLETAEDLFKQRYNRTNIQFESETDYKMKGVLHNRGNFFRNNGYRLDPSQIDPRSEVGVSFVKVI